MRRCSHCGCTKDDSEFDGVHKTCNKCLLKSRIRREAERKFRDWANEKAETQKLIEQEEFKQAVKSEPHWNVPVNPNDICGEVRLRYMRGERGKITDVLHIQNCELCQKWRILWRKSHGNSLFKGFDLWGRHQETIS